MFDFHTHTVFSDGSLIPSELVQRASVNGYKAVALTDHVDFTNVEHVLGCVQKAKSLEENFDLRVLIGVEITHVPPDRISELASKARKMGAELVLVHGETLVEPVAPGTNLSAVKCKDVDILAHPGLITVEEAELARENDVMLEITSRKGHSLSNGHVARIALETGAKLIFGTDTHNPEDILTREKALQIISGSGINADTASDILDNNARDLLGLL